MMRTLLERAQHRQSTLWTLIAPPTIWSLHFLFCYVSAAILCAKGGPLQPLGGLRIAIAAATAVALALVAVSFYIAFAQMRLAGDQSAGRVIFAEDGFFLFGFGRGEVYIAALNIAGNNQAGKRTGRIRDTLVTVT